jgi:hypothetical protein
MQSSYLTSRRIFSAQSFISISVFQIGTAITLSQGIKLDYQKKKTLNIK